jgi:hypothetical protein
MWIKRSLIGVAVLLLLSVAWRYRHSEFITGAKSPAAKPAPLQFDNGSVRAPVLPASGADGQTPLPMPPVGLRKCVKGGTTTYTDGLCPTGSKERTIDQGSVSVLPGAKPGPVSGAAAPLNKPGPKTIRDVLVPPDESQRLRDQRMDRVIGQ